MPHVLKGLQQQGGAEIRMHEMHEDVQREAYLAVLDLLAVVCHRARPGRCEVQVQLGQGWAHHHWKLQHNGKCYSYRHALKCAHTYHRLHLDQNQPH